MKKAAIALLLLAMLLIPMYAGIARIRRLPRSKDDEPSGD